MYFKAFFRISEDNCLYAKNKCDQCGSSPAIELIADCHGDSIGPYCQRCWRCWFENELLLSFHDKKLFNYKFVDKEDLKNISNKMKNKIESFWTLNLENTTYKQF